MARAESRRNRACSIRTAGRPSLASGARGTAQRAVAGHIFGLNLDPKDKAALIAFLRTL
jgi:hypothetical protein